MNDPLARSSASPAMALLRRYVTDYVNRHDFSVIPEFMAENYTLETSGIIISGRDGAYRSAVARQLNQFPGLVFTPHEIVHVAERIGIRFTEHGMSVREGRVAAWPSIAIYRLEHGRLASCAIEQDYWSRNRQLAGAYESRVDAPASAPWDTSESTADPAAAAVVVDWLQSGDFFNTPGVQIDDSRASGSVDRIVDDGAVEITEMLSGGGKVAFHAVQRGSLAGDFARDALPAIGQPVVLHMTGLVTVRDGVVVVGNMIRDRLGLYRRLTRPAA